MSPTMEPSSPSESGIRKRVCKACDRCRLKKSKCDGASPCSRCKVDNAICFFGERKKSHDKVYPKGYVEMLESQQGQLVAGLQELYRRLQQGQGWTGAPLKDSLNGAPLTHDILERIGALKQEGVSSEHFEENLEILQQRLIASGAGPMKRELSFDASMESPAHSPVSESMSSKPSGYLNPFAVSAFPPTPPDQSPHPGAAMHAAAAKHQYAYNASQFAQYHTNYTPGFLDDTDFMSYEPAGDMSLDPLMLSATHNFHGQDAINPCLTMKNWDSGQDMRQFRPNVFA